MIRIYKGLIVAAKEKQRRFLREIDALSHQLKCRRELLRALKKGVALRSRL